LIPDTHQLELWPTVAVFTAWLPTVISFFLFLRIDWRRNAATRAVMVLITVALVTISLALGRQFGYPPPDWVRGPVYLAIGIAMWFLLISFVVIQRRGRQRDEKRLVAEEQARSDEVSA
jgi:protein-S-isoprenylcysteine O-methyltransferase Ste14